MPYLTKAQILEAPDLRYEDVDVSEWGGVVRVRGMTGTERDAFEASIIGSRESGNVQITTDNIRAKLAARCIVNEQGVRLFSDAEIADLGRKSAQALTRVFEVAQRLSGLTQGDVDDLAKNSGAARNGVSISG